MPNSIPEKPTQCAFDFEALTVQSSEQEVYKFTELHPPSMKQCTRCKKHKPATTEFFNRKRKTSLNSWCKQCMTEYMREKRGTPEPPPDGYKQCSVCKQVKPATREFFERSRTFQRQRESKCRQCQERIAIDNREDSQQSLRQCSACEKWKPATIEFFHQRNARKSGLSSWCIDCHLGYNQAHIEKRTQYNFDYRQTHKEEARLSLKRWKENNKEYIRTRSRRYYIENKERMNEHGKQHYRSHREQRKALNRNRRARKKAIPGTLTASQVQHKLRLQHFRCYYCSAKFERKNGKYIYHLDHIVPLSRPEAGPRHDMSSTAIACPCCNLSKGTKLPHEWPNGGRLL